MQLLEMTPMLWVPDLKTTVDFYTNILGFTCFEYSEEWQWASLSRNTVGIMLAKPNEHTPYHGPSFTGSFYIRTDDVEAMWHELKDKTEIVYPIDSFDYGMKEFAIKDNNGFMIQFGQEIPK